MEAAYEFYLLNLWELGGIFGSYSDFGQLAALRTLYSQYHLPWLVVESVCNKTLIYKVKAFRIPGFKIMRL